MQSADQGDAYHILLPILRSTDREGWVVIEGRQGEGAFPSLAAAEAFAEERFPEREVVIRQAPVLAA
jgi:hypothetical protein